MRAGVVRKMIKFLKVKHLRCLPPLEFPGVFSFVQVTELRSLWFSPRATMSPPPDFTLAGWRFLSTCSPRPCAEHQHETVECISRLLFRSVETAYLSRFTVRRPASNLKQNGLNSSQQSFLGQLFCSWTHSAE